MDDAKTQFIEALHELPGTLSDFLATPLPTCVTVTAPDNVDDAIIAQGKLAAYLLDLFAAFAGLTPIPIFLRIGQHNPVIQSMLLAGLEYIESAASVYDFEIRSPLPGNPAEGGTHYTNREIEFTVEITQGAEVSTEATVTISEPFPGAYSLLVMPQATPKQFKEIIMLETQGAEGEVTPTASFTVVFNGQPKTKTMMFWLTL